MKKLFLVALFIFTIFDCHIAAGEEISNNFMVVNNTRISYIKDTLIINKNNQNIVFRFNKPRKKLLASQLNKYAINKNIGIDNYYTDSKGVIHKYEIFHDKKTTLVIYEFLDELDGKEIMIKSDKLIEWLKNIMMEVH